MERHPFPLEPHPADLEFVVGTLRALADPTRCKLSLLLAGHERSVGDLTTTLGLPQSTVSRHLALLRAAGIVTPRRAANRVYYRLSDAHVADLLKQAFAHAEHERLGLPDHSAKSSQAELEVRS